MRGVAKVGEDGGFFRKVEDGEQPCRAHEDVIAARRSCRAADGRSKGRDIAAQAGFLTLQVRRGILCGGCAGKLRVLGGALGGFCRAGEFLHVAAVCEGAHKAHCLAGARGGGEVG